MDMKENKMPDGNADGVLHGDQLIVAERIAAARPGSAIRMGEVIERIIVCDNLERPISHAARMPKQFKPQCAGPSGLNAHLPPFRRRIDLSDEDEPVRPVWPPRRAHLKLKDGDYVQKRDAEPELPRRQMKARRRINPFFEAEAEVDKDASGDEGT